MKKLFHVNTNLSNPSISSLGPMPRNQDLYNYKKNKVKSLTKQATPLDAMNTVYYYDLDITHSNAWRIFTAKKRDKSNNPSRQQKQLQNYLTSMTID
eukprot:1144390-Pelagomonas_calceolata.AAC.1